MICASKSIGFDVVPIGTSRLNRVDHSLQMLIDFKALANASRSRE